MATYYVRRTGNDGALGTSPSTAWLTIDKAANTVAAGDTVYIGAGVYREVVTMDTSGSSGNQISFIGDIGGAMTGDPGPVIISAHNDEVSAPVRAYCLNTNEKEFITWQYVAFTGGTTAAVGYTGAGNIAYEGCQFLDCTFLSGHSKSYYAIRMDINFGIVPATTGLIVKRCTFMGGFRINHKNQAVAHINIKWTIENCLFVGHADARGVDIYGTVSDTYSIGGISITNCTFLALYACIYGYYVKNNTNPCLVTNNWFYGSDFGVSSSFGVNAAIWCAYNSGQSNWVFLSGNCTNGGNNDDTVAAPVCGGLADLMFYQKIGWSPWKPCEPMVTDYYTPCLLGTASDTYAPADDLFANPRPMGRNTDDIGAVEANPRGSEETTTVRSGGSSLGMLRGAGYQDKLVQVDASSTTIEVYGRYDANYTGSNPILRVLNIPGVADQSDAMAGGSGAWEKLECTFTPTSAGFVRVRLESRDTSANGECFFDDLRIK